MAVGVYDARELGESLRGARRPNTIVRISDGDRPIHGPPGDLDDAIVRKVTSAGRTLTLEVATPVQASFALPATLLVGGLTLTGLIALLLVGYRRRERYAVKVGEGLLAEREEAEGALRASEQRFLRAFADSGVGMALCGVQDGEEELLDVNDALCELTGYSREELLHQGLDSLTHPDDAASARAALRRLMRGEEHTVQTDQRMVDREGRTVWVLLNTSLVRDDDGSPTHRIVQLQDVSEHKRFERQLQHLADHDALTGLFNRRRFEEELNRELASGRPLRPRRRGAGRRPGQPQVRERLPRALGGRRADHPRRRPADRPSARHRHRGAPEWRRVRRSCCPRPTGHARWRWRTSCWRPSALGAVVAGGPDSHGHHRERGHRPVRQTTPRT